jgi:hypothetical protein
MNKVEDYIYSFEGDQLEVLLYFHDLLTSFQTVTSKIRFKIPFYYQNTWVCYLNPVKPNKIAICFLRGYEMSNEQDILESKGRKQVQSAEFASVDKIPKKLMSEIINEALFLDETVPYQPKSR